MTLRTLHPISKTLCSALVFTVLSLCACSGPPSYPQPQTSGDDAVFDIGSLQAEKPVFYSFRYERKSLNFFVFKTGDKVLSFLDACAKCYPSKLGYRIEGRHVVCRKCEVRYALSNIGEGFGSCYPIRLEGRSEGPRYLIPLAALRDAAGKF